MRKVVVESPLSGDFEKNSLYTKLACIDCIRRGEAPYASHIFLTLFLDDTNPEQRSLGMKTGFIWAQCCTKRVVYQDLGISKGMQEGIDHGNRFFQEIEYRNLPEDLMQSFAAGTIPHKTQGF